MAEDWVVLGWPGEPIAFSSAGYVLRESTYEIQWSLWGSRIDRVVCERCGEVFGSAGLAVSLGAAWCNSAFSDRHYIVAHIEDGIYEEPSGVLG